MIPLKPRALVMQSLALMLCASFVHAQIPNQGSHEAAPLAPQMVELSGALAVLGGVGYPTGTPQRLRLIQPFAIGRNEVTISEFRAYALALQHGFPASEHVRREAEVWRAGHEATPADWPANEVTWSLASGYAGWLTTATGRSFRLPTEFEWEFAAAGPERRLFPWGNDYARNRYNGLDVADGDAYPGLAPVGSFPEGSTQEGVNDLSGNVKEWCSNHFVNLDTFDPYESLGRTLQFTAMGGFFNGERPPLDQSVRNRSSRPMGIVVDHQGFRLAAESIDTRGAYSSRWDCQDCEIREEFLGVPVGSASAPWVLLHTMLGAGPFAFELVLADADDPGRTFRLGSALSASVRKDSRRGIIAIRNDKPCAVRGATPFELEDHLGQTLFVFSQTWMPEFFVLGFRHGRTFVAQDLVEDLLSETDQTQDLAWALPAIAYFWGGRPFTNRFGELLDINRLTKGYIDRQQANPALPCLGHHYSYCLAYLSFYDQRVDLFDADARALIMKTLEQRGAKTALDFEECWGKISKVPVGELHDAELCDALVELGHGFEWIALQQETCSADLPSGLSEFIGPLRLLAKEAVRRLGRADDKPLLYGSLSHAVHALCLSSR